MMTEWLMPAEGSVLHPGFLREQKVFEMLQWLGELRKFPRNWNSRGAERPATAALANASVAVEELAERDVFPTEISPMDYGGILFGYRFSGARYYWEFESDGDVGLIIRNTDGEHPENFTRQAIPEVISRTHGPIVAEPPAKVLRPVP